MRIIPLAAAMMTFLSLTVYSAINYRKKPSFGLFVSIVACGSCVLLLLTDMFCPDSFDSEEMALSDIFAIGVMLASFPCSFEKVSVYRKTCLSHISLYVFMALLSLPLPQILPLRLAIVRFLGLTGSMVNMTLCLRQKYSSRRSLLRKIQLPWMIEYDSRMFYSSLFFSVVMMYGLCSSMEGRIMEVASQVMAVWVMAVVCVMTLKVATSRSFILSSAKEDQWKKQVTAKVEQQEDTCRMSECDRDRLLFEKIQAFMRDKKPFLDPDFNVNCLSRSVLSNKLYTSRAVNNVSGMNFCRYVNGYRVEYAKSLFRSNPGIKVMDVSEMCGFRNLPSFNMAFKICTGQTPSEWIRENLPG